VAVPQGFEGTVSSAQSSTMRSQMDGESGHDALMGECDCDASFGLSDTWSSASGICWILSARGSQYK
jgi:hypothetical protein